MERRRVALVGQEISEEKCTDDVVTGIMKAMDARIADSGNKEFYDILKATARERAPSNLDLQPKIKQPGLTLSQKKVLGTKRHILMEKVQKNMSYIKHNRSMPKPRAHLGGLRSTAQNKVEVNRTQVSSSPQINSKGSSSLSIKYRPKKFISQDDAIFDDSASDVSSKLPESDSESEFETFIESQKQNTVQSSKSKKILKSKKDYWKARLSEKRKRTKSEELESVETKSSDDEVLQKKGRKCKNSKISSKVTNTNRLMLPKTSESSAASSDEYDVVRKNVTTHMPSVETVEVPEQMMCSVRLERNKYLEETVSRLNSHSPLADYTYSTLPEKEKMGFNEYKNEVLVSDDECMIVCEVSRTSDTGVNESKDSESDIQILNVVSLNSFGLKESEEDTEANCRGATSEIASSSCIENLACINFEKLKKAIETTRALVEEISIPQEKFSDLGTNTFTENSQTVVSRNLTKETCLPVPADIIETVNKIDFKQILSLVKDEHNEKKSNSFNRLTRDSNFVRLENRNFTDQLLMSSGPSTSTLNSSLNSLDLREILFNADKFKGSKGGNTYQDKSFDGYCNNINYENSYDELDVLSSAAIQNMYRNQSSPTVSKLINSYTHKYQEYIELRRSEETATVGVKMMKKLAADNMKEMETILEHIIKHDPCSYEIALKQMGTTVNQNSSENERRVLSEQIKKCVNCGSKATIDCGRCNMVYFCSEKCGIEFWENKHYKECIGLK